MDKNTGFGKTPPRLKRRINRGPAKGTILDFSLEEGRDYTKKQKKDIKPIEEGDMGPPSTVTPGDFKEVARMMGSPVQNELAELGKGRELINKVEGMPGIESESDKKMKEIIDPKPSETEGGGILEMFGLAGGGKRSEDEQDLKDKEMMIKKFNQQSGWDDMTAQQKYNAMENMLNDDEITGFLKRVININKDYFENDEDFKMIKKNPQSYIDQTLSKTTLNDIKKEYLGALVILLVAIFKKNNPTGGRRRRRKSKKRRKRTKKRRRRKSRRKSKKRRKSRRSRRRRR